MTTRRTALTDEMFSEDDRLRFVTMVLDGRWVGPKYPTGYGKFHAHSRDYTAHAVAYALEHGEVPAGKLVRHTCDNLHADEPGGSKVSYKDCIQHEHLLLGTERSNAADRVARGRGGRAMGAAHGSKTCPESVTRGSRNGMAKLTFPEVLCMRILRAVGVPARRLAPIFGVHWVTVYSVCGHKTWAT